jgi:hypothetical protein
MWLGASLPITNKTLTVLASTALLAANTFPCTTKLWEELDPMAKTWTAFKTAYLAAHKKRANCLCTTGGANNLGLGQANPAHTNQTTSLLDSTDNTLDIIVSTAANKKAVLEKLVATNSSLATSNTTHTNQVKTLCEQLAAKTMGGGGQGKGINNPTKKKGPYSAGYSWSHGYCVGPGHTGHACSSPKKGYQPTVTCTNIMGDSTANKDWAPKTT